MQRECYMQGCLREVMAICSCSSATNICSEHISTHKSEPGTHNLKSPPVRLSTTETSTLLLKLQQGLTQLNDLKSKIISQTQSLLKEISSLSLLSLQKISDLEVEILSAQKSFLTENHEIDLDEFEKLSSMVFIENLDFSMFPQVKNSFAQLYSFDLYRLEVNDNCDEIILPKDKMTGGFWTINFETLRISTITYAPKIGYQGQVCRIDKGVYFIYGGQNNTGWIGDAYTLDLNAKTSISLPSGLPKSCAGSVYKNRKVYVFGGFNKTSLKSAQSFDVLTQEWKDIHSLPLEFSACTAGKIGSFIIMSGYEADKVYAYDLMGYLPVIDMQTAGFKVVCNGWVVTNTVLYENENGMVKQWKKHNIDCQLSEMWVFSTFRNNQYIYFIRNDNKLWRVDTQRKTVMIINKNN